jgi:hypothetical protein
MLRSLCVSLVLVATAVPVAAQAPQPNPLASSTAFNCTFVRYGVARWDAETPTVLTGEDSFTLGIAALDTRRNRANIVGTTATVPASAVLTPLGLNVIEQTPGGNFILTTIFTATQSADTFYAVHARHLGDVAAPPSASQSYGTCEAVR